MPPGWAYRQSAGGGFTVEQVADDTDSSSMCVMRRGVPGSPMFSLFAMPNSLEMIVLDPSERFVGGGFQLWVDGRYWTANGTVSPTYPNQIDFKMAGDQTTANFAVALAAGSTFTLVGTGGPGVNPIRYNVPLTGSTGALRSLIQCEQATYGTPPSRNVAKNIL